MDSACIVKCSSMWRASCDIGRMVLGMVEYQPKVGDIPFSSIAFEAIYEGLCSRANYWVVCCRLRCGIRVCPIGHYTKLRS